MITIKNERGVALVFVMILALIGLAIVSSLIYMITTGTRSSGAEKFYRSSDEAALGGARIGVDMITTNFDSAVAGGALSAPFNQSLASGGLASVLGNNACLTRKLHCSKVANDPLDLSCVGNWLEPGVCNANMINMDPGDTPDMTFTLRGEADPFTGVQTTYNVDSKIVDTIVGNTAGVASGGATGGGASGTGGGGLSTGGVGGGGASIVTPPRNSWMYRIEVQAQAAVNPRERARYSVLYAH